MSALNYTPIYSAVMKIARMLVLSQAYFEQADEVRQLMEAEKIDVDEATQKAQSVFSYTRQKVQRFMTRVGGSAEAEPSPIDWIIDSRRIGLKIRFDTAAPGMIDWEGNRVQHRDVRITIGQLSDMMHSLVQEMRELLAKLTMLLDQEAEGEAGAEAGSEGRLAGLLAISWDSFEDD